MNVKWVVKRLMVGVSVLFIISFLSFFIMHLAPGDPATAFYGGNAQTLNAAEKERISRAFSLDRPVIVQYGTWLKETMQGNLGYSSREGRPVKTILLERLPNTLLLFECNAIIHYYWFAMDWYRRRYESRLIVG